MKKDFPGRGKVAVLKTRPETVMEDYARLMELAGFRETLPQDKETILKINISWQTWYPACSTAPWQLEGVIRSLQAAGYQNLIAGHNDTVVSSPFSCWTKCTPRGCTSPSSSSGATLSNCRQSRLTFSPPSPAQ
jgi:hypothetical protein